MTTVHFVLPNDIDDPATPSGGNVYDRQVSDGLSRLGWSVREHAVPGDWPTPGLPAQAGLARVLASLPDAAVVLLDGLVACAAPEVLAPQAQRLRLVILVHQPLGEAAPGARSREEQALAAASAIVTTSNWCRNRLLELYSLTAGRIHVAAPGVLPAAQAPGSAGGSNLLCVAVVAAHKGHDLLVQALSKIADSEWRCVCVGSLGRDPDFAARVRAHAVDHGIADRISFVGVRTGADLDAHYAAADLVVLASRGETFGMVVTEALARGLPVLATAATGMPEALGLAPDGTLPGILTPPDDAAALAEALQGWLADSQLRQRLRQSAGDRRDHLTGWAVTSALISSVLSGHLAAS